MKENMDKLLIELENCEKYSFKKENLKMSTNYSEDDFEEVKKKYLYKFILTPDGISWVSDVQRPWWGDFDFRIELVTYNGKSTTYSLDYYYDDLFFILKDVVTPDVYAAVTKFFSVNFNAYRNTTRGNFKNFCEHNE